METQFPGKERPQVEKLSARHRVEPEPCINRAGEQKRNQGGSQHVFNVVKDIRVGQFRNQERTGRNRGTTVSEIGTG